MADLTGNGGADLLGFGDAGVWVALGDGAGGFFPPARVVDEFAVQQGWQVRFHPRMLADLTGDGRPDIVGFADDGVYVALNDGAGGFGPAQKRLDEFGINQDWDLETHPRFAADVTGDGRADIVGFADNGVRVALNDGAGGFGASSVVVRFFGVTEPEVPWSGAQTPRLLADLTGNGASTSWASPTRASGWRSWTRPARPRPSSSCPTSARHPVGGPEPTCGWPPISPATGVPTWSASARPASMLLQPRDRPFPRPVVTT